MPFSRLAALYLALTLCAQLVCWALLWVARSSQGVAAAETLPLIVPLLVGLLFVGGTYGLGQNLRRKPRLKPLVLGAALVLNGVVAWAAAVWFASEWFVAAPLTFVLAPLVAVFAGEFYGVFGRHAAMLAAMSVYIVCTLLANFTFDSFLELPLYGQLSVGTLFFGVTFTQRDRVHRFGKGWAYQMIAVAALSNLALSAYLGIPLRFLLAGFLAILIAEAADTEVYQRFVNRCWLTRVATSNAVSIPIDSVTFTAIAFAGSVSLAAMSEIVFADILAKTVVGLLAAARIMRRETPVSATTASS